MKRNISLFCFNTTRSNSFSHSCSCFCTWAHPLFIIFIALLFAGFPPLNHTLNTSYLITVGDILAPDPQPLENMSRPLRDVPPSGSKMPPLKDFQLTKELVQKRVKDNVIIVTFGNYAFVHFILNWVKHLTDLQVDNLLVGKFFIDQKYRNSRISERLQIP